LDDANENCFLGHRLHNFLNHRFRFVAGVWT